MSALLTDLGIDRLSVSERLLLIGEIWDSISPAAERLPITQAERTELERRLAALDADPANVVPWEQVEARALARFRK